MVEEGSMYVVVLFARLKRVERLGREVVVSLWCSLSLRDSSKVKELSCRVEWRIGEMFGETGGEVCPCWMLLFG
jgi:hypothetical protein